MHTLVSSLRAVLLYIIVQIAFVYVLKVCKTVTKGLSWGILCWCMSVTLKKKKKQGPAKYMNQLQVGDIFSKALSVRDLKEKKQNETWILLKLKLTVN